MNLQKMIERFQTLAREQRDFLENIVPQRRSADPAFDFAKDEAYMRRSSEMTTLQQQIAELRRLDEAERQFDNPGRTRGANPNGGGEGDDDETQVRTFANYLTSRGANPGNLQMRSDLVSSGTTTGGYTVPTIISNQIIQTLAAVESVRRAGASVMTVVGNENIPSWADATANFVAEGSQISATDPTTGQVTIRPTLLAARTTHSWHLQNRSVIDIQSQLRRSFANGIATAEAAKFLSGTGTDQPQGALAGGTSALTAASTTVVTAAELDTLWYALHPSYQANATWIVNNTLAAVIRGLESANGQRLWVDNIATGVGTLYGRPVIIDPTMPAPTAGLKPIIVGDFGEGYVIGEEVGLTAFIDPYTKADYAKVVTMMYKFVDGRVRKAAALQYITMHA